MSESDIALTVRDVYKRFRRTEALRGCSFDVERGSITALVGANGAGKSTLMSIDRLELPIRPSPRPGEAVPRRRSRYGEIPGSVRFVRAAGITQPRAEQGYDRLI
ncbi:ABC transporter family protein [Rhodococcus sp. OK519]|uniref:ATP-binding protein n=1 Tax=Rhodococcus sp. OK519 TaxID=2135729 RepID=UPI000D46F3CC|nr:ABC transporter family protein [Rhodococcus sp. OK519]